MTYQKFFKNRCCSVGRIILIGVVGLIFFSCSPQVIISSSKSYPPREDNEPVVFYKKAQDIPIESEEIGKLEVTCGQQIGNCDSTFVFSVIETKIKKAGGNALLITNIQTTKPQYWTFHPTYGKQENSILLLNGDVFLVSNISSPPDTTKTKAAIIFGVGFGQEIGISFPFPKIGYYNFQDRKILSTYYGIEGCIGMFNSPWLSLDCLYGVKKSIFTLDTSIGVWWLPKSKYGDIVNGPHFHSTINPKVGIKFWKVWLKAGPSIHLYRNYPKGQEDLGIANMGKIGNKYYNFEILIAL